MAKKMKIKLLKKVLVDGKWRAGEIETDAQTAELLIITGQAELVDESAGGQPVETASIKATETTEGKKAKK